MENEWILLWPLSLVATIALVFGFEGVKWFVKPRRRPERFNPAFMGRYGCEDDASMRDWQHAMQVLEDTMVDDMEKLQWKERR